MRKTTQEWMTHIVETYFSRRVLDAADWAAGFSGQRDKIVVHIPARAGSERVAEKNIHCLNGIPLMAYTIAIARALPADRVIVNTNSAKYAAIAEQYGAEVPFLRPEELSGDYISPGLASFYAQRHLMNEDYPVSLFIDMYPTTPFRNIHKTRALLKQAQKGGHCFTCVLPEFFGEGLYCADGTAVQGGSENLRTRKACFKITSSFMGQKLNPAELNYRNFASITDPVELIDIDNKSDLLLAEKIIDSGLYDFGVDI